MRKRSLASRIYLSLIGLSLAGVGGVFAVLMWKSFMRAEDVDHWPLVPCSILESRVGSRRDDPDWPAGMPQEFRFEVRYVYEWQDRQWESTRYRLRGAPWSDTPSAAEELVLKYPEGSVAECHVNPDQPDQAVLRGETKAAGYSLWFPLLFVVGGLGIVAGAWRPRSR
ncbi:DUF3592 domain-containing protein [Haloferula sargassicola]|uniref:DUF3592 domain-containing protein n=1 Tax=Haloferula sargassicola TaxID=490096 RepID=A0ABP9UH81_9BACT